VLLYHFLSKDNVDITNVGTILPAFFGK